MSPRIAVKYSHAIRLRFCAASIHLGASILLASIVVLMVAKVWYPSPFFALSGGRQLFLLITGCDLVLGPLLTLVIFDVTKPRRELARDIAVVAAIQLSAMIYGLWTILQARPVFIVYNAGQFNVTAANDIRATEHEEPGSSPVSLPWLGPKLVAARLPTDPEERNRLLFSAIDGRGDVYQMPRYFVPYDAVLDEVKRRAKSAQAIAADLHKSKSDVERAAGPSIGDPGKTAFLPVVVRQATAIAVVDLDSGTLIRIEALPGK